ncbi:coatomer subunit epsilon [Saccharomyces eubayanus]|uniref:coatomer subunit epsilon n=1 Tax=Saccharomyces eubayanus TaxID=1080349 RepID=UPI0006C07C51|nr:SEC28-like protein [Saccharomyces eubayanus]KOG98822.1 SEC28-like protein [Saccharomyces eubayanus]
MDYFNIKQNYYTGNFVQCLQEVEKFNKVTDNTLLFYKAKTLLALNQYQSQDPSSKFGKALDAYVNFLDTKDITELEGLLKDKQSSPYELHLLASAQAILGNLDESLETCVEGIDNDEMEGTTELLLLAIEVALLNNQASTASVIFDNYTNAIEENITGDNEMILNLAESYIKFGTNKETATSNFYYYEELSQTFPTWKTQLGLLNLHLQQRNIAEAQGIVELLLSDYYSVEQKENAALYKPNFLANQITLALMQGADTEDLTNQLVDLDHEHAFIKHHQEIDAKFDELVGKYDLSN